MRDSYKTYRIKKFKKKIWENWKKGRKRKQEIENKEQGSGNKENENKEKGNKEMRIEKMGQ